MKILIAASEMEPFTSPGEFGNAILEWSGALEARGHEVSVVIPYYRSVRENGGKRARKTGARFTIPVGSGRYPCEIREARAPNKVQVFFVERDEFFDRSGLYGIDGRDYQDNAARFTFFARCVVELARRMDPAPEILHSHNWQAALVPVFSAEQKLPLHNVLSVHSLEAQGNFWSYDFGLTNLPGDYFSPRGLEYYGSLNMLKGGLLFAERVVLPGPRYVSEAQTREHGCGLDPVMREQAWKLEGIVHGMNGWMPSTDKTLPKRFKTPDAKTGNRKPWLAKTGLQVSNGAPVVLSVTDSMIDDGMGSLLDGVDRVLESGARIAVLGKISRARLAKMEATARKHRGTLAWLPDYDDDTLRLALAGSDAMLFGAPTRLDARMLILALRYGLAPVSVACGGIHSLAPAVDAAGDSGVSFLYYRDTPDAVVDTLRRVSSAFQDKPAWNRLVERAMAMDYSWAAAAERTERLYAGVLSGLSAAA